jgi:glycosyltransferase involved in cell wall biosynthesis
MKTARQKAKDRKKADQKDGPLKILQLCLRFHPAPGGVETHVLEISKVLKAHGHDVEVYTTDLYKETPFKKLDGPTQSIEEVMGIKVRRFKAHTLGDEMHYVFTPSLLAPVLSSKADLIHAHSYGYFHVNLAAMARKMTGKPFVMTAHFHPQYSMWGGQKRKSLRAVYDKILGGSSLEIADRIIVHTRNELGLMSGMGVDEDKVRVIPAGVDLASYTPQPDGKAFREATDIKDPFILYAGRIAVNKGLDHLVQAFARVRRREVSNIEGMEGLKLILIGEDHGLRASLEKVAKKEGVSDHVVFTGHIETDRIFRSAFGACELLALPSDYEAFGLVLVEAMACSKPCVATRVGGVPEVIDEDRTGLLVDFGDVQGLARALTEVLSDPKKAKEMGTAGRKRVEDKFTWETVTTQIEKVYREVL